MVTCLVIACRHPRRQPQDLSRPVATFVRFTNFQSLTNCLALATYFAFLSFQLLTTIKFCNLFVLITIQHAGVWGVCSSPTVQRATSSAFTYPSFSVSSTGRCGHSSLFDESPITDHQPRLLCPLQSTLPRPSHKCSFQRAYANA